MDASRRIARDGYLLLCAAITPHACAGLRESGPAVEARAGGARNVLRDWPQAAGALHSLELLARALLGRDARPVRAILFDKTPASNWAVPWHQDLSIPVRERHETEGYSGWSCKEGVWHAQPPRGVLENMLALRLHLDDCGGDNAPLRVLPGSHALGRLDEAGIAARLASSREAVCTAQAGDVLAMRPLLLHASNRAALPGRRRVLHVEYAACELPAPLAWQAA